MSKSFAADELLHLWSATSGTDGTKRRRFHSSENFGCQGHRSRGSSRANCLDRRSVLRLLLCRAGAMSAPSLDRRRPMNPSPASPYATQQVPFPILPPPAAETASSAPSPADRLALAVHAATRPFVRRDPHAIAERLRSASIGAADLLSRGDLAPRAVRLGELA